MDIWFTFDELNIPDQDYPYQCLLTSCARQEIRQGRRTSGLIVQSMDGYQKFKLNPLIECDDVPDDREEIPTPDVVSCFDHMKEVELPPLDQSADILLIGRDLPEVHLVQEQLPGLPGEPFEQRLSLGWVVVGNECLGGCHPPDGVVVAKTLVLDNGRPSIVETCIYSRGSSRKGKWNLPKSQRWRKDRAFHRI